MSPKYSRYIGIAILESCFASYVIVKSIDLYTSRLVSALYTELYTAGVGGGGGGGGGWGCAPIGSLTRSSTPGSSVLLRCPLINPRRACAARVTQYLVCKPSVRPSVCPSVCLSVRLSVRPSVCYHVFCHYAQQGGQKAIPTGSVPHWVDFKNGDFRKSTAFKSYCVKKPIC